MPSKRQPSSWSSECDQALPTVSPAPAPVTNPQRLQHVPQAFLGVSTPLPHAHPPQPPAGGRLICHPALPSTPLPAGPHPAPPSPANTHGPHTGVISQARQPTRRALAVVLTWETQSPSVLSRSPQWLAGLSPLPPHRPLGTLPVSERPRCGERTSCRGCGHRRYTTPREFYFCALSRRCTGVSVPFHFVPSPTGLPSKRCPGIRFISRADREIGVFH